MKPSGSATTRTCASVAARTVAVAARLSTTDISPKIAPGLSMRANATPPSLSIVTEPDTRTYISSMTDPAVMRTSPGRTVRTGRAWQWASRSVARPSIQRPPRACGRGGRHSGRTTSTRDLRRLTGPDAIGPGQQRLGPERLGELDRLVEQGG